MAKKPLIVGNWKMYITKPDEAKSFATTLKRKAKLFSGVDILVAPPFTLIPTLVQSFSAQGRSALGGKDSAIRVGAQTISPLVEAKSTGEVSGAMLKNIGASFAIVGHSERRALGESDETVRAQLERAREAKLVPILCVGEKERDLGGSHFSFIESQLVSALRGLPASTSLVVAYEPVWAIGKTAEDAMKGADLREMSIFIRKTLTDIFSTQGGSVLGRDRKAAMRVPILYGGSVEPSNAAALLTEGDVQGFLVGHASTQVDSFAQIIQACAN